MHEPGAPDAHPPELDVWGAPALVVVETPHGATVREFRPPASSTTTEDISPTSTMDLEAVAARRARPPAAGFVRNAEQALAEAPPSGFVRSKRGRHTYPCV